MDTNHTIHIAVGCIVGAALFAALLIYGAGLYWATAAFVFAMVLCHGVGFYYLRAVRDRADER